MRLQAIENKKLNDSVIDVTEKLKGMDEKVQQKQKEIELILSTHKELKENFNTNFLKRESEIKEEFEKKERRIRDLETLLMSKVS